MYLRDDKVKHTKKPEWGSGIVLEDEKDGKVAIKFRDAGKKTIATAMDFLHIVYRIRGRLHPMSLLRSPDKGERCGTVLPG